MKSLADFASTLKEELEKAKNMGTRKAHAAVYNFVDGLITDSPVREPGRWFKGATSYPTAPPGHFKNNWQVGINEQPNDDIAGGDVSGSLAKDRAAGILTRATVTHKGKKVIHVRNNAKSMKVKKGKRKTNDFEGFGESLSQLPSYAMAIEEGVGMNRDTWTYQLDDKGRANQPGALLARAKLNWVHDIEEVNFGARHAPGVFGEAPE